MGFERRVRCRVVGNDEAVQGVFGRFTPGARRGAGQNAQGLNVQLLHETLREEILSGEMPPGAVISQLRLSERLGVSRTPLREAIRLLEREGLVESEANHRSRVTPLSVSDLEQLYAMRVHLEALGASVTIPRLGADDLGVMESTLSRMSDCARTEDYEGWEPYHRAFHEGLVSLAGDRLVETISRLYRHTERYRRYLMKEEDQTWHIWPRSISVHREIFDAVCDRNPAAASEKLAHHYSVAGLSIIASLAPGYDPELLRAALRTVAGGGESSGSVVKTG